MKAYTKLAKNSFLFALGSVGSKGISFLMLPLYTRFLTTGEYGEIDVFLTTILLLTPLITVQASEAVFRFSMDENKSHSATLVNALFLCFSGFLVLLLLAPLLTRMAFFSEHAFVFYLVLLSAIVDNVLKQFTRGIGRIKHFISSDILYAIVFATSNVVLICILNWKINGYLYSLLCAHFFSIVFLVFFCGAGQYFSFRSFDFSLLKLMVKYSIPLIPTAIMWWVMNVSNRYFISYFLGFEATGIYAVACKIPVILTTANIIFFQAWQISAIEGYGTPDFKNIFYNVFRMLSLSMIIFTSLILLMLKPLFAVMVTADFFVAWKYVPILLLGVIFSTLSSFWGVIYVASKKTTGALITSGAGALMNICLNILLIPIIGIHGALISTVIAYLVMWVVRYLHIRKINMVHIEVVGFLKGLFLIVVQIYIILNIYNPQISYFLQVCVLGIIVLSGRNILMKSLNLIVPNVRTRFFG
jgi:O-antigen/teichoic acid export membrane protein